MNRSTAVIVASFGTTHQDALEKCIASTEREIASHFTDYPVYRAFTSRIVIRRLKERYGMEVDDLARALERVRNDGFKSAVIQPTLVLGGIEYDLICRTVQDFQGLKTSVGRPLIAGMGDCETAAGIIMRGNRLKEPETLVLMGHGTEHAANAIYGQMQNIFDRAGYRAYIATVEGEPSFEDAVAMLIAGGARKARLLPLMFVAGDHAKNDMAGPDDDSLRSLVEKAGIEAEPVIRGLGEDPEIRRIYVERAEEALGSL